MPDEQQLIVCCILIELSREQPGFPAAYRQYRVQGRFPCNHGLHHYYQEHLQPRKCLSCGRLLRRLL